MPDERVKAADGAPGLAATQVADIGGRLDSFIGTFGYRFD
jgi:hypothetical protein